MPAWGAIHAPQENRFIIGPTKTSRPERLANNLLIPFTTAISAERPFPKQFVPCPTSVYQSHRGERKRSNRSRPHHHTPNKFQGATCQGTAVFFFTPVSTTTRVMPCPRPHFVFACFKRVERCGDWVTGAAGPFFVASATLLFVLGTLCFRMSLSPIFTTTPLVTSFVCKNDKRNKSTSSSRPFRGHGSPSRRASSLSSTCSLTITLPAPYPLAFQVTRLDMRDTASFGQRNDGHEVKA